MQGHVRSECCHVARWERRLVVSVQCLFNSSSGVIGKSILANIRKNQRFREGYLTDVCFVILGQQLLSANVRQPTPGWLSSSLQGSCHFLKKSSLRIYCKIEFVRMCFCPSPGSPMPYHNSKQSPKNDQCHGFSLRDRAGTHKRDCSLQRADKISYNNYKGTHIWRKNVPIDKMTDILSFIMADYACFVFCFALYSLWSCSLRLPGYSVSSITLIFRQRGDRERQKECTGVLRSTGGPC